MLSLVIPVYNEEENIASLYARVSASMDACGELYEVLVIDDGSRDATPELLQSLHERDPRWKVLLFSRNFGHQTAISAGIHHAQGDAVAVMDGDLQDPPEVLPEMFARWRAGSQVVYAIRQKRKENLLKRTCYKLFYRLLRRLASIEVPLDAGDFCVMDRAVVDVLRSMPERTRFVRGLRSWAGFRQTGLEYERHARQAGKPKYTLIKLVRLAASGIVCFSSRPLRVAGLTGLALCLSSMLLIALLVGWWLTGLPVLGVRPGDSVGWTSLTSLVLFLSGLQMLMIGIVGEYLARVFDEVKQRPPWVIARALGVEAGPPRYQPGGVFPSAGPANGSWPAEIADWNAGRPAVPAARSAAATSLQDVASGSASAPGAEPTGLYPSSP
ncbi:MAG: glycosyltransferase family 2 protein [Pirellulaceae bacterium]|nr:glycosyltransferase family 2 protein [Pirellulaceae bacterium]